MGVSAGVGGRAAARWDDAHRQIHAGRAPSRVDDRLDAQKDSDDAPVRAHRRHTHAA